MYAGYSTFDRVTKTLLLVPTACPPQPVLNSKQRQYNEKGAAKALEAGNVKHDSKNNHSVQHASEGGKFKYGRNQKKSERTVDKKASKKRKKTAVKPTSKKSKSD